MSGRHFQRTAELWLENMDRNRRDLHPLLASTYGAGQSTEPSCSGLLLWPVRYRAVLAPPIQRAALLLRVD